MAAFILPAVVIVVPVSVKLIDPSDDAVVSPRTASRVSGTVDHSGISLLPSLRNLPASALEPAGVSVPSAVPEALP